MPKSKKILGLMVVGVLLSGSTVFACYTDYFDEIFAKVQQQKLDKDQMAAIAKFKQDFAQAKSHDHSQGKCDKHHDAHVPSFIASAAGVLDDAQFKAVTGKEKSETQKLRYEIFRLKQEIAEIKAMIAELKK